MPINLKCRSISIYWSIDPAGFYYLSPLGWASCIWHFLTQTPSPLCRTVLTIFSTRWVVISSLEGTKVKKEPQDLSNILFFTHFMCNTSENIVSCLFKYEKEKITFHHIHHICHSHHIHHSHHIQPLPRLSLPSRSFAASSEYSHVSSSFPTVLSIQLFRVSILSRSSCKSSIKILQWSWLGWHTPAVPELGRRKQAWVQDQPGL